MNDWMAAENEDRIHGNVIHVVPVGDLVEHDTSAESGDECICNPTIEAVLATDVDGDSENGWLIVHNAWDGREHDEPGHDRENCSACRHDRA